MSGSTADAENLTVDDLAKHAIKLGVVNMSGMFTEAGTFYCKAETTADLVVMLSSFIVELEKLGIEVIGGCSDAANVMKRTLKDIRTARNESGKVFFILMDFDHNHKNSRNMLLTHAGVIFSMLTLRKLWMHVDDAVRRYFKFLTLRTSRQRTG